MTTRRSIRASDQDRESAAEVLRGAYAAGCLDSGELEQRSGAAYTARTLGELEDLTADLPAWLLERPLPLPYECFCRSPRHPPSQWPVGLMLALAGFWLTVVAVAWVPLAAIPLTFMWLLLALRARDWLFRAPRRQRPRLGRAADPGGRRLGD